MSADSEISPSLSGVSPESRFVASPFMAARASYWTALSAVVTILLCIIWIPAYNTLVDYPFHLSRVWALHNYDHSPFFQRVLVRVFDPMPNLAIDLFVPPLLNWLPPVVAGKVFLSAIVVLFAAGCHLLSVAQYGGPVWTAPIATFAVINSPFLYGFVNSTFSLSLFLVTFAVWLRVRRHWTLSGWVLVASLATCTYISHLSGFVFLVVAMSIHWLLDRRQRPWFSSTDFATFSVLVPAIIIQLYPWTNRVHIGGQLEWGTLGKKALGLGSIFLGFRYDLDILALAMLAAAFGLSLLKCNPRFNRFLLVMGLAFLAASIICPTQLTAGAGAGADGRFAPPALIFLLLSFSANWRGTAGRVALFLAFAAMLLRIGEIGWTLDRISSAAERQLVALGKAAPNSRIYNLYLRPQGRQNEKRLRANLHLACYSLIFTGSVPSDFIAQRYAQPLFFRNPSEWATHESPTSFEPAFLDAHLGTYDYVWGCNLDADYFGYLRRRATLISTGDVCGLWKLRK